MLLLLGNDLDITGDTDVDYAGSLIDGHSITGYCVFLGGNLVSWRCKKQSIVARSSV